MPEKVYWTKRDGTQIDVDEMSVDHLRNTLKMLIENRERELYSGGPRFINRHIPRRLYDASEVDLY